MKKMALLLGILMVLMVLFTGCATLVGGVGGALIGGKTGAGIGLLAGGIVDYLHGVWDFQGTLAGRSCFVVKPFNGLANRVVLLSDLGGEYVLETGRQVEIRYPVFQQGYRTILTARVESESGQVLGTAIKHVYVQGSGYYRYQGYYRYRHPPGQDVWHITSYHRVR